LKITRLTSTEVANAASLSIEKRPDYLRSIERTRVNWGYKPVIDALPKLLLCEAGLFGHLPTGNQQALLNQISKSCKSGAQQRSACLSVAKAILNWVDENGITGRLVNPEPLRMSVDTLQYCADVAVVLDGRLYVINLDPRSTLTLSPSGREFIKSLIYHTALIGDLRTAKAALLRAPRVAKGIRKASFEVLEGQPILSLEEILQRVNETYSIWEMILRARTDREAGKG
jgi:hypothetical protein